VAGGSQGTKRNQNPEFAFCWQIIRHCIKMRGQAMHRCLARFYYPGDEEIIRGDPIIQYHLYYRVFLIQFGKVKR